MGSPSGKYKVQWCGHGLPKINNSLKNRYYARLLIQYRIFNRARSREHQKAMREIPWDGYNTNCTNTNTTGQSFSDKI